MIELRPAWCHQGDGEPDGLEASSWRLRPDGAQLGDDGALDRWRPGDEPVVQRTVRVDPVGLTSALGLPMSARFALGASWYCRATSVAGTGPLRSLDGVGEVTLTVRLQGALAGEVVLETCLLLQDDGRGGRTGRLVWSDTWNSTGGGAQRTLILEGDMMRIPVVPVDFDGYLRPEARHSLWHISIDPEAQPHHPFTSAVTIQINASHVEDEFDGDLSVLSDDAVSSMRVDLLRAVALRFLPEWDAPEVEDGTLGAVLRDVADATAGGWQNAARALEDRPTEFDAALRSRFAGGGQ